MASGLQRRLGSWRCGAFVVSSMLGTGILTTPATIRAQAGGGTAVLGVWLGGAVLALCGALCFAELGSRMPRVGGEYQYLRAAYGPLAAFVSGWISLSVGFSAAMAAAALGAADYMAALGLGNDLFPGALAAVLLTLVTLMHLAGTRLGGALQIGLAAAAMAGILGLAAAALLQGEPDWTRLGATTSGQSANPWVALVSVTFAYSGWNGAAYLAAEARRPQRSLPRALIGGTIAVAAVYLLFNAALLATLHELDWAGGAVGHELASRALGARGARAASSIAVLLVIGSLSAMAATGPRIYVAMARDGLAPRALALLSARGTPRHAIVLQSGLALLFALTGSFENLLVYIGSALLLVAAGAVSAVAVIRVRHGGPEPGSFRVPLYPLPPLLFIGVSLYAWGAAFVDAPVPTIAGLLTIGLGAVAYRPSRRRLVS